jgi:hypothetical protein
MGIYPTKPGEILAGIKKWLGLWWKARIDWVDAHDKSVLAITSISQVIIAGLMLWTLSQNHSTLRIAQEQLMQNEKSISISQEQLLQNEKSISISQKQFESTINPSVDVTQYRDSVLIRNSGIIPIADIKIIALCAVNYEPWTGKLLDVSKVRTSFLLLDTLLPKNNFRFSVAKYLKVIRPPVKRDPNNFNIDEAYCYMLRYRRAVDMEPYTRFIHFQLIRKNKTSSANAPDSTVWLFDMGSMGGGAAVVAMHQQTTKTIIDALKKQCLDLIEQEELSRKKVSTELQY